MKYCFLQVSDNLLNPVDKENPADVYFKSIWSHLDGEGYFKPDHFWEIPLWIAELSYCLKDHELELFHIEKICPENCSWGDDRPFDCYPVLPDADIYFASVMDCNKEYFRIIAENNPDKHFYLGGYIGQPEFIKYFYRTIVKNANVSWYRDILTVCKELKLNYQYGTDYSLFKGMKCIPRLTLSNGCTNHCRFCTVPDKITTIDPKHIQQQIESMRNLNFELVYINDKTFGQASNYRCLKYIYNAIKWYNPKFRGFTIQTTCHKICNWAIDNVSLKDLHIVNVEIGVESYNNSILEKYQKPQSTKTIDNAVYVLKKMDVNIIPNIIIGLPGETWRTYTNTDCWLRKNMYKFLMLNVTNFVPYVGSDDISTTEKDFNENSTNRSYHTAKERFNVQFFTENIFDTGMEILEKTKARSI